jgi:hypothetical protein
VLRSPLPSALLGLALAACDGAAGKSAPTAPASTEPAAGCSAPPLECDREDNDCDGDIDEVGELELRLLQSEDRDGDGWAGEATIGCPPADAQPALPPGDCDDADPDIHPGAAEQCFVSGDEDCDSTADCYDTDCDPTRCIEDCDNAVDDDDDGRSDCRDRACDHDPACPEACADGVDNDDDGLTDCADPRCLLDPACVEDCDDGLDNDEDGRVDCADADCEEEPACVEDCADRLDNDADGRVDCADADCEGEAACVEVCDDGLDNDEDGRLDCIDPDCRGTPSCIEDCYDGVDNDADRLTDCADRDCRADPGCIEHCSDGVDNDRNGLVDCEDTACADDCAEDCNHTDNDLDGLTGCDDPDCGLMIHCWDSLSVHAANLTVERNLTAVFTSAGLPFVAGRQVVQADGLRAEGTAHTAAGAPIPCTMELLNLSAVGAWADPAGRSPRGAASYPFTTSAAAATTTPPAHPDCPLVRAGQLGNILPDRLLSYSATWAVFPGDGLELLTISQPVPGGWAASRLELRVASPSTYHVRHFPSFGAPWVRAASQDPTGTLLIVPTP